MNVKELKQFYNEHQDMFLWRSCMRMKIGDLRKILKNLEIDEYEYFILDSGKGPWAEVYVSLEFKEKQFYVTVVERGNPIELSKFKCEEDACDKFLEFMRYNKKVDLYVSSL